MKKLIIPLMATMVVGLLCFSAMAQETPSDPIAYFPLDGDAVDASGNGNDGILHCPFSAVSDRHGSSGAMFFDGNNDFIEVPTSATFSIDGDMTLSFWINRESLQNQGQTPESFIFSMVNSFLAS